MGLALFGIRKQYYGLGFALTAIAGFAWAETQVNNPNPETEILAEQTAEIEDIFQVELIVVRPRNRDALQFEDWDNERPTLPSDAQTQLDELTEQPLELSDYFSWVEEAQYDLPNTLQRLEDTGAYEVLLFRSWRQQATPRDNATEFFLQLPFDQNNSPTAMPETEDVALDVSNTPAGFQTVDTIAPISVPTNVQQHKAGLFGSFSFSKARYLHFTVDMLMTENQAAPSPLASSAFGNQATSGLVDTVDSTSLEYNETLGLADLPERNQRHYHLSESRRVKTEETHYFDHPAFGVIAHARRLTPEEQAEYVANLTPAP